MARLRLPILVRQRHSGFDLHTGCQSANADVQGISCTEARGATYENSESEEIFGVPRSIYDLGWT